MEARQNMEHEAFEWSQNLIERYRFTKTTKIGKTVKQLFWSK